MAFGSLDNGEQEVMSEINMTPLVDVMLVLLIIIDDFGKFLSMVENMN